MKLCCSKLSPDRSGTERSEGIADSRTTEDYRKVAGLPVILSPMLIIFKKV
ncbi:MAG: hypothetical protein ABIT07_13320 [Ferruginibacter sp.]